MALNAADAEIDRHGAAMGESSEVMRQKAAAFRGVAWKQRIERAALYDPLGAADLYQANTGPSRLPTARCWSTS
jgi:hypothetical protein